MKTAELHSRLIDLQARFADAWARGMTAEVLPDLFEETEDFSVSFPWMREPAKSLKELAGELERQGQQAACEPHIFHSPHIEFAAEGRTAYVTWESYGYRVDADESVMITSRFTAVADITEEKALYRSAEWMRIQEFSPLKYGPGQKACNPERGTAAGGASAAGLLPDAETFFTLRNMTNILFANNWNDCGRYFTADACVEADGLTEGKVQGAGAVSAWLDSIREYEAKNGGRYFCLMIAGPCSMRTVGPADVSDRYGTVYGSWLTQSFEVSVDPGTGKERLVRRIFAMDNEYADENGEWKIRSLKLTALFELPELEGTNGLYQRMLYDKGSNWLYKDFNPDTGSGAAALAVENIFSFWPLSVHRAELGNFYNAFIKNDVYEGVMSIRSQGPDTPVKTGEEEILGKLLPMEAAYTPGQITYHCATTPVVELSEDGNTAHASWIDHSLTNFGLKEGRDDVDYMVFVTRYDHVFRKVGRRWFLTEFNWEPCLGVPFLKAPADGGDGWVRRNGTGKRYPFQLNCTSLKDYRAGAEEIIMEGFPDA